MGILGVWESVGNTKRRKTFGSDWNRDFDLDGSGSCERRLNTLNPIEMMAQRSVITRAATQDAS
jgi:hypothetical protein